MKHIFEYWKDVSKVAIEKVDVQLGSVILTLCLELPVALFLFQLVQQRHAALADLRVRCCLLDGKVARLDDRDDIESCEQKLLRPNSAFGYEDSEEELLKPKPEPEGEMSSSEYKLDDDGSLYHCGTGLCPRLVECDGVPVYSLDPYSHIK